MASSMDNAELLKRFREVFVVGKGAFGRVYRGLLPDQDQAVAIKVLLRETSPSVLRRFLREAEALRSLESDHVVKLFAMELKHVPPYLVMEWIGGGNLGTANAPRTPADPAHARQVAREMLAGVRDLHAS